MGLPRVTKKGGSGESMWERKGDDSELCLRHVALELMARQSKGMSETGQDFN